MTQSGSCGAVAVAVAAVAGVGTRVHDASSVAFWGAAGDGVGGGAGAGAAGVLRGIGNCFGKSNRGKDCCGRGGAHSKGVWSSEGGVWRFVRRKICESSRR